MLFKLSALIGYALKTPDLDLGPADDFYLDELTWEVPYAKTRQLPWFRFERMLVSMKEAASVEFKKKSIEVFTNRKNVKGPSLEEASPEQAEFEKMLQNRKEHAPGAERLRSCRELLRYRFLAEDENLGLVSDMLADERWNLRYWLVDVDWPSGKKALAPAAKTSQINAEDRMINAALRGEDVKNSPWIDTDDAVDDEDERRVDDYYRHLGMAA